jgi:energy-coupling factor transporter ATP-binding protein EcfA2
MAADGARTSTLALPGSLKDNPFPGLRPFDSHESALFFGRDEQCDDLLARLARNRLVAVVGASGSGKSSLVRAGLLPALQRGYLPSAGSSWQIATFRPGGSPTANLVAALAESATTTGGAPSISKATLAETLSMSSLGLVEAAARLLGNQQRSLLVLADQFEEIFRYRSLAASATASEDAVECIDLLLAAAAQDDVPVYVILTMRSDYLGDCARFEGLPEALSDSQFLVPHMTREQLREAIEGPVAVGGGRITPGLVQRILHDVDAIAGRLSSEAARTEYSEEYDHDQLPVVQHALMRVWEVSRAARAQGRPIDLEHYERPPVETIHHALDRHAEEIYMQLPTDEHRDIARLIFQRLTERDAEREVRRPTPLTELIAVVAGAMPAHRRESAAAALKQVLEAFRSEGRAFVVINAQDDVDIAHESFIRKWRRLREWVKDEARSRRIYLRLAETAAQWEQGQASLYRGPELAEADRWWKQERRSPAWAKRYDERIDGVGRFLSRSRRRRTLALSAMAAGVAATIVVAIVMTLLWRRAVAAEGVAQAARDEARSVRDGARLEKERSEAALNLLQASIDAARAGNAELADKLRLESSKAEQQAYQQTVVTPAELKEIDFLRKSVTERDNDIRNLRAQVDATKNQLAAATMERDRLQKDLDAYTKTASTNPGDDKIAALQRERDDDRKTIQRLQAEIADLKSRAVDNPNPNTVPTKPVDPGSVASLFEGGVRAYDLRQYVSSVRFLQDAIDGQAKAKALPKEVRMSGTRFVPYAPNSYLTVVLFDMKAECSVMARPAPVRWASAPRGSSRGTGC